MKKYRLLKDLPEHEAGTEYVFKNGTGHLIFLDEKFAKKNPDWFEEIKEECKHERVTKIGDALTTGVYVKCDKCDFQKFRPFKPKPSKLIKSRLPRGGL